jgi:methyltransferase
MIATSMLLGFVTIERLGELLLARRNTKALLAKGAREAAPGHYVFIVALHATWLVGLWILSWDKPIEPGWLGVFILLQGLRFWVLGTLGKRWTTRIIVLPGSPLVRTGPYRFLSHPNYVVVIGEIAVLPLCFGLVWFALAFSALNAFVLAVRIREENCALSELRHDARP